MTKDLLNPKWETGTVISQIPIGNLKSLGMKLLILDVDGTLVSGRNLIINRSVHNWIREAQKDFKIHLLSNNPSHKRISAVAKQLDVDFTFAATKPRKKNIENILSEYSYNYSETALIGDRIFTDVLGGNRMGIYTVLVKSINTKGTYSEINFVHILEKLISSLIKVFMQ